MNGSSAFAKDFVPKLLNAVDVSGSGAQVLLAPPSIYIAEMKALLGESSLQLAAQNVAAYEAGAYTGEVSAEMLTDLGCQWCLVGHSERRALFSETDEAVVTKVSLLLGKGIRPILCVGETLEERESGRVEEIVLGQIDAVFGSLSEEQLKEVVVAYEPVWAIGTGKTATPEQAQEVHKMIRDRIAEGSSSLAENLTILYGGSVNAANAKALFEQEDIDGGLVGGASLKVEEFSQICEQIG